MVSLQEHDAVERLGTACSVSRKASACSDISMVKSQHDGDDTVSFRYMFITTSH